MSSVQLAKIGMVCSDARAWWVSRLSRVDAVGWRGSSFRCSPCRSRGERFFADARLRTRARVAGSEDSRIAAGDSTDAPEDKRVMPSVRRNLFCSSFQGIVKYGEDFLVWSFLLIVARKRATSVIMATLRIMNDLAFVFHGLSVLRCHYLTTRSLQFE